MTKDKSQDVMRAMETLGCCTSQEIARSLGADTTYVQHTLRKLACYGLVTCLGTVMYPPGADGYSWGGHAYRWRLSA